MGIEKNTGLGVGNFYGPRGRLEGLIGQLNVDGAIKQLMIEFTGQNINDDVLGNLNASFQLPAGSKVLRAIVVIEEAFVLGGTTPTIDIGTDGSEGTNGFDLSEAEGEAVDVYEETTFAGTWADRLVAATTVSVALGGSSPTVTAAGRARIIIEYVMMEV